MSILIATHLCPTLSSRDAIIDAILRFCSGLDIPSRPLLESAFTSDAVQDLTKCSSIGIPFSPTIGRNAIIDSLMRGVGEGMDTQHNVSNFRINVAGDGKEAELTCNAIASHYRKGEGCMPGKMGLVMGSAYVARLKRAEDEGGMWRMERLEIHARWCDGDLEVVTG